MHVVYPFIGVILIFVVHLVNQYRLHVRDREDRELARYALRKKGDTEVLAGFAELVEKRRERPSLLSFGRLPKS